VAIDVTKTVKEEKMPETPTIVHKHNYEALSVAAIIIALIVGAVYCQTHGAGDMAAGFTTCALLLGVFKIL
jgi:uncharacterized protein HemX